MNCNDAHTLIGPYLDGELSETQAAPLRRHLLACVGCRTGVQEHKDLQRWFVEPAANAVPRGFAARVAQAAFAPATPVAHAPQAVRAPSVLVPAAAPEQDNRLLRYVLTLTSVAAAATILVVLAARDNRLPDGDGLRAAERPQISMDTALERLEALQRAEAAQVRKP